MITIMHFAREIINKISAVSKNTGWTSVRFSQPLPPNTTYDIAVTNRPTAEKQPKKSGATWLTRTALAGGGGRIEVQKCLFFVI
jgi:hypothetical protein